MNGDPDPVHEVVTVRLDDHLIPGQRGAYGEFRESRLAARVQVSLRVLDEAKSAGR